MIFAHVLALAIWLHQAQPASCLDVNCYVFTKPMYTSNYSQYLKKPNPKPKPHMVCHAALVWPHDDLSGEGQQVRVCWVEDDK